jgi:hypothetical protein
MNGVPKGVVTLCLGLSLALATGLVPAPDASAQGTKSNARAKPATAPSAEAPKGSSADHWDLNLKSVPPGALAKAANGGSCTTPCVLNLPQVDTSVTFTLAGYLPQVIPVKWFPAMFHYEMYERTDQGTAIYPVDFSPNPAVAQLMPSGKAKAAEAKPAAPKKKPAAAAPAAEAPPQ